MCHFGIGNVCPSVYRSTIALTNLSEVFVMCQLGIGKGKNRFIIGFTVKMMVKIRIDFSLNVPRKIPSQFSNICSSVNSNQKVVHIGLANFAEVSYDSLVLPTE